MECNYLHEALERRDRLCQTFPVLIGRHAFYQKHRPLIAEGMALVASGGDTKRLSEIGTTLLKARACEKVSHLQRIRTTAGDQIHNAEYELYSLAFDVFMTRHDRALVHVGI